MQQDPPVTPQQPVSPPQQGPQFYQPTAQPAYVGSTQEHAAPVVAQSQPVPAGAIQWEASEYIHNAKGSAWLITLVVVVAVLVGAALWLQEWSFAAIALVMGVAFGIFAFRQPHTIAYMLDDEGVEIAGKLYPYQDFRAFAVLQDGAFFTMTLIPIKRFSPALSVYFAEADGEKIVDMVGDHLPMETIEPDFIDTLMRRLRF